MNEMSLAGRTIAVPETRELDVFAGLLERRGARVLRCPLVAIRDAPDPAPVVEWVRKFIAGACDDLVLMTGEGLRRLQSCIEGHAPELESPFVARLAQVRIITRGPKPARVLRELGLRPGLAAIEPTTAGVIATLRTLELNGRRVGVQLYGTEPNRPLVEFLAQAGASVSTVAPYVYADASDDAQVMALVDAMAAGTVNAIAFTSKAQVERLFAVVARSSSGPRLLEGLARTVVAAVGPVVRDELADRCVKVAVMPTGAFFLKPLVNALAAALPNPRA